MNKYYLLTVEDCSDKTHIFDTKQDLNIFLDNWMETKKSLDDGDANWIRKIYYGEEIKIKATAWVYHE